MLEIIIITIAAIFLWRFIKFISTPFLKKIGFYKYYSPTFLTVSLYPGIIDIHLGTSWDYFKHRSIKPKLLLGHLAEGLVNLCEDIEKGKISKYSTIQGNIYYLKSSTTSKFGFKTRDYNIFEYFLFSLNYIELCILKSVSYGKPSIVQLRNNKIHYCLAKDILNNKPKYLEYLKYLKQPAGGTDISPIRKSA